MRRKQLTLGSIFYHVGILIVFFGHLVGLSTPIWALDILGIPFGLGTITVTLGHRDGSEMVRLMAWSQSVGMFKPNAWAQMVDVHSLYKFHIFLGLLITILFPFTHLVHIISPPVRYKGRPGYQVVCCRQSEPLTPRPIARLAR